MPDAVFVYGTLMPGHLRWGLIAPFARASREAVVPGSLYDTGRGWPAARFHSPVDVAPLPDRAEADGGAGAGGEGIPGWLVELGPASVPGLLAQLDEVEGALAPPAVGDYRRVRVVTADGDEAWAYEGMAIGEGWQRVAAWQVLDEN